MKKTIATLSFATSVCFFLFIPMSWAQLPVTLLDQVCWPPEQEDWTIPGQKPLDDVHCLLEDIIIQEYRAQIPRFNSHDQTRALVNAPVSGTSETRGRHLLSFSAFNGFRRLASWGLFNGANINAGDRDNATMLRMSIANSLDYMIRFSMEKKSNPNLIFGKDYYQHTALTALLDWKGSLAAFELVINKGGRVASQEEFNRVAAYLESFTKENPELQEKIDTLKATLQGKDFLTEPLHAQPSNPVQQNMIEAIDRAFLNAMATGKLSEKLMDSFRIHGKWFEHFLAFNGFHRTLSARLKSLSRKDGRTISLARDDEGNDLLIAAIKSKSLETVKAALSITRESIRTPVPNEPGYYSAGQTPLGIAEKWGVSDEIIKLLKNP